MAHFNAHRLCWVLFAGLWSPVTGLAQDTPPSSASPAAPYSMPFGECNLGYWSSNRNLDDRTNLPSAHCAVNWKPKFNAEVQMGIDLHLGWQDHPSAHSANIRVREGYLAYDTSALSVRLGRQIVAWGRADRINPTDVLSPKDFTLLSYDDEGQRTGIDAMKLRYAFNPNFSRFNALITSGRTPVVSCNKPVVE